MTDPQSTLQYNSLVYIPTGLFALGNVASLILNNNPITLIDSGAFQSMTTLSTL